MLALCGLLGLVAVLVLPEAASLLPLGDRPEPNETQLALTSLGVLLLTGAYLYATSNVTGLSAGWAGLAFGYNAAIVVVKFIFSPASYYNSPGTALSEHLGVGVAVLALYAAALTVIYAVARRNQHPRRWAWPSKVGLVLAVVVFAMVSRSVAAVALGRTASDYLEHIFAGAGLWLPVLIIAASWLAIEAFDRAAHGSEAWAPDASLRTAFGTGLALLVVYHGLWVVFMLRLF